MPESSQLIYVGDFGLIPYALGNVVTIGVDWINFPGAGLSRRAKSIGGSYVCGTPVQDYNVYDTMAIPGETARQDMIGQQWVDIPVPGHAAFAPLFPPSAPPGLDLTWRGPYAKNSSYNPNDLVSWKTGTWVAMLATNAPPPDRNEPSTEWSPLIPPTGPRFRGDWNGGTTYYTGDLVQYTAGTNVGVYALTTDTSTTTGTSGVPGHRSSTTPDQDQSNWTLVLQFSDPAAAAWLGVATIGTTALNLAYTVEQRRAAAARLAADMNTKITATFARARTQLTNFDSAFYDIGRILDDRFPPPPPPG